jgi:hypothetical protein
VRPVAQGISLVAVFVAVALGVGVARGGASDGELVFVQDAPADVRAETAVVWDRFRDRFDARASCWDDVSVELVRSVVDGDARYVASAARIEIQIPTTPERYRESLVHELAHHVDQTCDEFDDLRSLLAPRLGASGSGWSEGAVWHEIPAERFAESVVELVNGERVRHVDEVPVDGAIVAMVASWGSGADS